MTTVRRVSLRSVDPQEKNASQLLASSEDWAVIQRFHKKKQASLSRDWAPAFDRRDGFVWVHKGVTA